MLTLDEEKYLASIPKDKKVSIQDFDPRVTDVANEIIAKIKRTGIKSEVWNMGSSGLEIAGQNDIDLNVLSSPNTYKEDLAMLETLFGSPRQKEILPMKWEFQQSGFDVELHLADATTKNFIAHLKVFTALKNDAKLRRQYEKMKQSYHGESMREYMKKKFEFFHEIL